MKKSDEKAAHSARNVKMVLEYDGTNYCGFQTQNNGLETKSLRVFFGN